MRNTLQDIQVFGGKLVKSFDQFVADRYIQCVADVGKCNMQFAIVASGDIEIFVDDVKIQSGEKINVALREKGYGYVLKTVKLLRGNQPPKIFYMAFLKPAPDRETLYSLENRPRFHYTPPYGYNNDPNGMIYDATQKKYHLFYQAYPYEAETLPKHWGHATTYDLVTFQECPTALFPDDNGDMWSGTAIVDYENTAKLYDENTPPNSRIILIYYARKGPEKNAGLAYTPDGGENWIKAKNGRLVNFIGKKPDHVDPKVLWSKTLNTWIMFCASGEAYTSNDLWNWSYNSSDKAAECPDIYEIKVEETGEIKHVRTYGWGYCVGDIVEDNGIVQFLPCAEAKPCNGDSFIPLEQADIVKKYGWHTGKAGTFYAVQHYAHAPQGRIISMGWMMEYGLDLSKTWAGAMSIATEQKLHYKNGEYLLYSYPVDELKTLRGDLLFSVSNKKISPNTDNLLKGVSALHADIDGRFLLDDDVKEIGFRLRTGADGGNIIVKYDVANQLLIADYSNSKNADHDGVRTMKMTKSKDKRISLRVLLDSIIVESFGNFGEACISSVFSRDNSCRDMEFFVVGGNAVIEKLAVYEMNSAWKN